MNNITRRDFLRTTATAAAAVSTPRSLVALVEQTPEPSMIRLGVASYTFRDFGRAHLIGLMKQLNIVDLNAKDVGDHLPADERGEAAAL